MSGHREGQNTLASGRTTQQRVHKLPEILQGDEERFQNRHVPLRRPRGRKTLTARLTSKRRPRPRCLPYWPQSSGSSGRLAPVVVEAHESAARGTVARSPPPPLYET